MSKSQEKEKVLTNSQWAYLKMAKKPELFQ